MLENLLRDPPRQSSSETGEQLIPDPWQATTPTLKPNSIPHPWQILPEPHPLIAPVGNPDALGLPASTSTLQFNPMQVLLLSGLKLRAYDGGKLKDWIQKALALLGWMGTVTQGTSGEILA